MSKTGGTTRTVGASGPPEFQLPYVQQMMSEAQKLYQSPGPSLYSGSTVAGFTPAELQASEMAKSTATGPLSELGTAALKNYNFGTTGALDVGNNPYLERVVEGAVRPIGRNLTENVLPNIRSGAVASGGYGGSRQGIAEGLAAGRTAEAIGDTTANIYSNAYGQGLNTFSQTMSQAPAIAGLLGAPAETMSSVGAQERAMEQAKINEDIARWQYEQNLPYTKLAEFSNLIRGPFGGQGISEVQSPQTGTAEQLAGAGLTLLPLIGQLIKLFS